MTALPIAGAAEEDEDDDGEEQDCLALACGGQLVMAKMDEVQMLQLSKVALVEQPLCLLLLFLFVDGFSFVFCCCDRYDWPIIIVVNGQK